MPLENRSIEPLFICRDNLPQSNPVLNHLKGRELECMANGSLANIIRQLSCLASYADDIFNGILNESKRLTKKTEQVKNRISKLQVSVLELDFQQEEVSFVDLNYNEVFKSSVTYDQEVLSRLTMPNSLIKKYLMCDKAPSLEKLNPYRDDGKDAMKFYTDPNFFFDLWKMEMLKKTEKEKFSKKMISSQSLNTTKQIEESHSNKQTKKPRKPENTTEKYRKMMTQQFSQEFADSKEILENQTNPTRITNTPMINSSDYSTYGTIENITTNRELIKQQQQQQNYNPIDGYLNTNNNQQIKPTIQQFRPNDQLGITQKENTNHVRFNQVPEYIPHSPVMIKNDEININNNNIQINSLNNPLQTNSAIPPPPPMPNTILAFENSSLNNNNLNNLNKPNLNSNGVIIKQTPQSSNLQTTSLAQEIIKKQQELRSAPVNQKKSLPPQLDARNTLLASIREGIQLRSVKQRQQKQQEVERDSHLKDVASILARRVAMNLSDSEGESNNESGDDWVDDN